MSTFNPPADIAQITLAKSSDVNAVKAATAIAFGLLPSETKLQRGTVNFAVDTGTANTYVVALDASITAYTDGLQVVFRPLNDNTGSATINLNSLGAKSIRLTDSEAIQAGDISAGAVIDVRYSTSTGFFHLTPNSAIYAHDAGVSATAAAASASTASTQATNAASSASSASTSASAASTSASNASTSASTATTQAGIATTQAGLATTNGAAQVALATTQAGIATTQAGLATTNGAAQVALATTQAGIATTQATNASTSATTATTQAGIATTQAGIATTQATNASTSASTASTQATNAASSASTASTQATNASTSATNAASSATAASGSASTATTQAGIATTQATNAASSATAASGSASTATTQAGIATTQATNASTSASTATTQATNASTSATTASTQATNAATSASTATTQATAAGTSATNAAASETAASGSASTASTQATNAASSASSASGSASTATTQATNASTSASAASTSATNASTSASTATTQATNASTSATNAATSATSAAASYDSFDDRYLGAKASNPTLDNDGNALLTGALYWNTTSSEMRVYSGSAWIVAYLPAAGYLALSGGTMTGAITFAAGQTVASASVNGILSSTDWNTFNGKQAALGFTPYNSTNPAGYTTNLGTVTSVTGTAPVVSSGGTTPAISMAAATTSVNGYLTSTDWNTFNGKYSTGGALGTPASGNLANCIFPTLNQNTTGTAVNAQNLLSGAVIATPYSGNLTNCTADGTNGVGFKNIPQNSQSAAYTCVLADAGKQIFHPSSDTTARTFTIPANSSVAYPIGTELTVINQYGAGVITLTSTDTLRLATTGTTGNAMVATGNMAQLIKVTSTEWLVNNATKEAPTTIGQAYGGGFYAGKINVSGTQYYLIVAPKASGENSGRTWGTYGVTTGISSVINGPTNSASLAALGAAYQAAVFAEGLTIGGYSDWYLPAKNELEVVYYFLKPTTGANVTSSGSNANAVSPEPISTNYTSGSPAQTSAGIGFRDGETNAFASSVYWTSTENSSNDAWAKGFHNGVQGADSKLNSAYVRAVRRIAV